MLLPGQRVLGMLRYTPDSADKIIGVYIKFVAYEHTEWKSSSAPISLALSSECLWAAPPSHSARSVRVPVAH